MIIKLKYGGSYNGLIFLFVAECWINLSRTTLKYEITLTKKPLIKGKMFGYEYLLFTHPIYKKIKVSNVSSHLRTTTLITHELKLCPNLSLKRKEDLLIRQVIDKLKEK